MIKRVIKYIVILIISILLYRLAFCYRVVCFSNEGKQKYKRSCGRIQFPNEFQCIVNPFIKNMITDKLIEFCNTPFAINNNFNRKIKHKTSIKILDKYKGAFENSSYEVVSIKEVDNKYFYFFIKLRSNDLGIIFIMDIYSDKFVGYYF